MAATKRTIDDRIKELTAKRDKIAKKVELKKQRDKINTELRKL